MKSSALFVTVFSGVLATHTAMADPASLSKIAAITTLSLPADTLVLGLSEDGAIDSFLNAKLSLNLDELRVLFESVDLSDDDFEESKRYLLGQNNDWWNPQTPEFLPTAQTTIAPGRILNLGVDRSDSARPVVYMLWHST